MSEKNKIKKKDKDFLWHPFTKIDAEYDPIVITDAKDDVLIDIDGKKYIDLISSWWVNINGHCRKEIVQSISKQSEKLEQVLFADFTHSPAVNLAEKLISILPGNLSRVFYSDNGSTAVEIAMKVAIQYWYNLGKKKNLFQCQVVITEILLEQCQLVTVLGFINHLKILFQNLYLFHFQMIGMEKMTLRKKRFNL